MTRARTETTVRAPRIRRKRLRLPVDRGRRRMAGLLAVYLLALLMLGGRLVQVQVLESEKWEERALAQRSRTVDLPARRGRIYDRDGDVLATSVDSATIYADPRAFRTRTLPDGTVVAPDVRVEDVADRLAPLIGTPAETIVERLNRDAHFVYLARQLDWEVGDAVLALELPGIGRLTEPRRQYPNGSLAAQVLGFTGIDGEGLEGLELAHHDLLSGTPGMLALERAPSGLTIASGSRELTPAEPGTDLVLTIDREIQDVAEQAALAAVEKWDAAGASVVVRDVATGDVLAVASVPGFDPADRDGTEQKDRRNRAVTDVFEPGSVQKAITIGAAMEEGIVTPDTVFTVADRMKIGPKTFSDSHRHPTEPMTVAEIMASSSNVGTMMIAQELGPERLYSYLQRFGYDRAPGIGFPGESAGLVPPVDAWWVTSLPTIAIGQGVAITLLHAANVYATIANDGVAVTPRIVRGTVDEAGQLIPAATGEASEVLRPETAQSLRRILAGVVAGQGGTGRAAAVPGYDVAGKTGTARKPLQDGRGYSSEYIATFVGMAPVERPELVVAVMVDEPSVIYGGTVAAPVFSEVMQFALRARHVPPTTTTPSFEDSVVAAEQTARAAAEAAAAAAAQEGPATPADEPGSAPVGTAAGGDGEPVADPQDG